MEAPVTIYGCSRILVYSRDRAELIPQRDQIMQAKEAPARSRRKTNEMSAVTLAEHLFTELGEAIARGDLAPGTKISEPALARRYGVSRGPLREALHRLQERKLISRSPNQGARVVQPTAQMLNELFTVREGLEGIAAREAAMHIGDADIAALHSILERQESELTAKRPWQPYSAGSADRDFHFLMAQASRNPLLINLLCQEFYPLLRLYRGRQTTPIEVRVRVLVEHRRILDAVADRDAELAELQMRRHIAAARERRETEITTSPPVTRS